MSSYIGLIVILLFIVLLFFNVPIAIALGAGSIIYCIFFSPLPINMIVQSMESGLDSFSLLAVPFFILAGDIMGEGGISRRLINLCRAVFGAISGSLGVVTVIASMIFAAISGSGPATVACVGGITIPEMIKEKYDRGFACALTATAGSMGPLIPPSICLIMYGVIAQQSITTLFMGGILPGVLNGVALSVLTIFIAKKYKFGIKDNPQLKKDLATVDQSGEEIHLGKAFKEAIWALLVPVIILGGIYSGIFTPTEAAIVACDYGLIVSVFVYKEVKIRDLPKIFKKTVATNGTILILVACATGFGRVLTMEQIPNSVAMAITSVTSNKVLLLILINILLLVVGCLMETLSALIILTPILLPVVTALGVNPIHFGLIIVMNLVIGQSTPPVGVNLFVAARVGESKIGEMIKWLIPTILSLILVQQIVTYVPGIVLGLPKLFHML